MPVPETRAIGDAVHGSVVVRRIPDIEAFTVGNGLGSLYVPNLSFTQTNREPGTDVAELPDTTNTTALVLLKRNG